MRRRLAVFAVLGALAWSGGATVLAQDQTNPDVLRKELAETMSQLKAAQDRKNELANEYEKLKAQMATMQVQLDDAQRAVANNAEHSYGLRSERAAWNAFVDRDPRLRARWEIYLETSKPDVTTGDWMLEKPLPKSLFGATTQPTTQPTTDPATTRATTPATTNATTGASGQ